VEGKRREGRSSLSAIKIGWGVTPKRERTDVRPTPSAKGGHRRPGAANRRLEKRMSCKESLGRQVSKKIGRALKNRGKEQERYREGSKTRQRTETVGKTRRQATEKKHCASTKEEEAIKKDQRFRGKRSAIDGQEGEGKVTQPQSRGASPIKTRGSRHQKRLQKNRCRGVRTSTFLEEDEKIAGRGGEGEERPARRARVGRTACLDPGQGGLNRTGTSRKEGSRGRRRLIISKDKEKKSKAAKKTPEANTDRRRKSRKR